MYIFVVEMKYIILFYVISSWHHYDDTLFKKLFCILYTANRLTGTRGHNSLCGDRHILIIELFYRT